VEIREGQEARDCGRLSFTSSASLLAKICYWLRPRLEHLQYIGVSIVGASNSRDSPYRASFAAVLRVRKLSSTSLRRIHGYYAGA